VLIPFLILSMIKGLGIGVWAKPLEAVTHGNFAHGESVSLQCRYHVAVAQPCAESFAVCTGVEGGWLKG